MMDTRQISAKLVVVPLTRQVINYPYWALRELAMNAIMHRDYQSHMPIRIYQFDDRIEIMNAGGLYGNVRPENFPDVNDYRNPVIAEAMKALGYVNRFSRGVSRVNEELQENGNGIAEFNFYLMTVFEVTVGLSKVYPVTVASKITEQVTKILVAVKQEMTVRELMEEVGIKHRPTFLYNYLKPALGQGFVEMTIPDKPNSRSQRYRLTAKGTERLEQLRRQP